MRRLDPTKRSLLRISAKILDYLGILNPFVIKFKLMFQGLCVEECDWDTKFTGSDLKAWNSILKEIGELINIKVPRYYAKLSSPAVHMELHGFSDASASTYAAVIYV